MRSALNILCAFLLAVVLESAAVAAPCEAPDHRTRVTGGPECLVIRTYAKPDDGARRVLYVLIHGNHSSGSPATSMFAVAEKLLAQAGPGTVVVALLRPGYPDAEGNRSTGDDAARGDNFTAHNIDSVAAAVSSLKNVHRAHRVVVIGHSGGAATTGVMLGRHPGLVDGAMLVGCPCDVPAWRALRNRREPPWSSESAVRYVDRIPASARIAVMVGAGDDVTPPFLSKDYVAAATARGLAARYELIEGRDHVNIINSPRMLEIALELGRGD